MSNILPITTNPNPNLRKKSVEINLNKISLQTLKKLGLDMIETMINKNGAGLAAPQIGRNIRLAVFHAKPKPYVMINPKIIKKSWAREWCEEGCLSVPDVFGDVSRHKKLVCSYTDENGMPNKITAEGLLARVIQHEIDHLDGILFIDKARSIKQIKKNNP